MLEPLSAAGASGKTHTTVDQGRTPPLALVALLSASSLYVLRNWPETGHQVLRAVFP